MPSLIAFLLLAFPGDRGVGFELSVAHGPAPLRVALRERASVPFASCLWDFGDGTTSSERNPVHVYDTPGSYDVRLTIESRHGPLSALQENAVRVERPRNGRQASSSAPPPVPNLLLVVLDDVGVDLLRCYGEGPAQVPYACTPTLDALAAEGLLFRNAFCNPLCSPTRAQILTGRHGFRTGIGDLVSFAGTNVGLSLHERLLPEILGDHDSALVGKWHLAHPDLDGLQHPLLSGFGSYAGSLYNLGATAQVPGLSCGDPALAGYYQWVKTLDIGGNGVLGQACSTRYVTADTIDDGIERVRSLRWPWFLEVSLNAVHTPADAPPRELGPAIGTCPTLYVDSPSSEPFERTRAILEVLDHELGRLLDAVRAADPNAYVFVIGDNGTDGSAAAGQPGGCFDPTRSKGSLYQSGIRVPLLVAGPGVVPGECAALVSAVDLFATFGDLAQVGHDAQDSVSLLPYLRGDARPRRQFVFSELFTPNATRPGAPGMPPFEPIKHLTAIQDARFKLMTVRRDGVTRNELFFDLTDDPCETQDLCPGQGIYDPPTLTSEQAAALARLRAELLALGVP